MVPSSASTLRPARVLDRQMIAPQLGLLRISRDAAFVAGQVIALTVDPDIPPRLYSIASGEGEDFWEVLFSVEAEGLLTPRLALLEAGDSLLVGGPSGDFLRTFHAEEGAAVWVGGGTGIAPFVSMAKSGALDEVFLVHAASSPELFFADDYLAARFGDRYHRCCSRATADDPRFFRGRVSSWLDSQVELPLDRPWLLCGGSEFVVDLRERLIARGLHYSKVRAEVYF